jgi:hypothetical protein
VSIVVQLLVVLPQLWPDAGLLTVPYSPVRRAG